MPHRILVAVHQIVDALQRSLIVRMPEPVELPQRSIDLYWPPPQISMPVDYVPVLILDLARLISCPACVTVLEQSRIREHNRVRLISPQRLNDLRKVVRPARAPRAIQPKLNQVAIVRSQFLE